METALSLFNALARVVTPPPDRGRYARLSRPGRRRYGMWLVGLLVAAAAIDFAPGPVSLEAQQAPPADRFELVPDGGPDGHDGVRAPAGHTGPATDGAAHAAEDSHGGGHSEPVAPVLLGLVIILLAAKLGGEMFERFGMPAVLGELTIGIVLGNLKNRAGVDIFAFLTPSTVEGELVRPFVPGETLATLAQIGVILLLFEVGLECTIRDMLKVGVSSLLVAVLGVVAPVALGYAVAAWFTTGWEVPLFVGATLAATSVGITARVLKDLGRSRDRESQIILGAAVIDDVLGLIVLAVVSAVITAADAGGGSRAETAFGLAATIALAVGFVGGAVLLGVLNVPRLLFKAACMLRGRGLLVTAALVFCFGMAYLSNAVFGLASIVGAFAAGLVLERVQYSDLAEKEQRRLLEESGHPHPPDPAYDDQHHDDPGEEPDAHGNHELEEAIRPLTALLVPVFFVEMGLQVELAEFADTSVWGFAALLCVAAVVGKQVCSFGVLESNVNKFAVGLGMIPRGEVGLIFADQGKKLMSAGEPVISSKTYSVVVLMVMFTTMVTPPLLKWSLNRDDRPDHPDGTPDEGEGSPISGPLEDVAKPGVGEPG